MFQMNSNNMLGKNYKKCRYCQNRDASSREHIIVNSRLRSINKFKDPAQRNDNAQKAYKNITCEACNNFLGEYESKRWSFLAYATIWKILAGNTNNAFEKGSEYVLKHSAERCIKHFEDTLRTAIESKNTILPGNTFTFNVDPKTLDPENKSGKAVKNMIVKCVDESGHPIKGAAVYMKPKGGDDEERGYYSQSDENGQASLSVLVRLEMVKIISEKLTIQNIYTKEEICKDIDIIIYVSLDPDNHRTLVIFPFICGYNIGWSNTHFKMRHRGFLRIVQDNISDIRIVGLKPMWNSEHTTSTD